MILNDSSRITRDLDDVLRFVADMRENEVRMLTYTEGEIELCDPMRAAIYVVEAASAYKRKQQEIQKTREITQERVEDEEVDHGRAKPGMQYGDTGTKQVPDPETIGQVKEVLALREQDHSYREIAEETGVPRSKVYRIVQDRSWYEDRGVFPEKAETQSD